ncbi:MAG: hypothetical protein DLM64_03535 [Solirubrobacterales bacterium]|nr:MAG: hypothetical protein DLM64_03535 [Solirubrobacterales bacterium]
MVTLDLYTGRKGRRIVAVGATVDAHRSLDSLQAIAETDAGTVLVGHGDPWVHGARSAVDQARDAGPA